jgi:hypothetical protein
MESKSRSGPTMESKFSAASCTHHHGSSASHPSISTTPMGLLSCPLYPHHLPLHMTPSTSYGHPNSCACCGVLTKKVLAKPKPSKRTLLEEHLNHVQEDPPLSIADSNHATSSFAGIDEGELEPTKHFKVIHDISPVETRQKAMVEMEIYLGRNLTQYNPKSF